jgi:hypothetical protein
VAVGSLQFVATFLVPQYYFWQYWATMVSKVYYGQSLASVLVYSNSWFSYTSDIPDLRMFSIMPDSHSFAVIAAMLMIYLLPLTYFFGDKELFKRETLKLVPNKISYFIWSAVRFSGLAVIFSGTRGVWVGMAAPFLLSIIFYIKGIARPIMTKTFWAMSMIVILFLLSPIIFTISNVFTSILNTQKKFIVVGMAPILYNLGIISGIIFLYPKLGVYGVGLGVIIGAVMHL